MLAPTDEWTQIFDGLRQRFPTATAGVLFCLHKLQQNPEVRLRDFKEEAALHRVPMSGRSFHSARVLLGLEKPIVPRAKLAATTQPEAPAPQSVAPRRDGAAAVRAGDDSPVIAALRRYQAESATESERLRDAIRRAIEVIDAALDG